MAGSYTRARRINECSGYRADPMDSLLQIACVSFKFLGKASVELQGNDEQHSSPRLLIRGNRFRYTVAVRISWTPYICFTYML